MSDTKEAEVNHQPDSKAVEPVDDGFPDRIEHEEEETQVTIRAILVGCILGAIVGASNLYLGLKTGFTFGPALFGAIGGFAILKPLSRILPPAFGGGYFGPKENCTVQTAATAAGGLGIIFVSAVPALYKLGLMSADPKDDVGKLLLLTLISAYYGLFFAIPLRSYFVIKQKLVFPTPTASAYSIKSFHEGTSGEAAGVQKAKIMLYCFFGAIALAILQFFAPGIFRDWHIFYWFYSWGYKAAIQAENWTWILEWTPAFIGAGMLSGLNVSASMWLGSFLAWGLLGPWMVMSGKAVGFTPADHPEEYKVYMSAMYGDPKNKDPMNAPSPRYWMLWPGVMMMVCTSFAELGWNWRMIYNGLKGGVQDLIATIKRKGDTPLPTSQQDDEDPTLPHENVPAWMWVSGVIVSAIFTIVVLKASFHVGVGEGILSIILAFLFAFIGLQSAGQTDVNPISAVAKTSQLVFGGVSKGQGMTEGTQLLEAQKLNLIGGAVAGAAAAQSVDMVGDLKTGHILRATPKGQFIAQIFGAFISVFLSVGLFLLYSGAYDCIAMSNERAAEIEATTGKEASCPFEMPSVGAWAAVATAVTEPRPTIPTSSAITAGVLGVFAIASVIIRNTISESKRHWIPNFNAIGIAFVLQSTVYSNAMLIGAVGAHLWQKRWPTNFEMFGFAVASGLIAGEGIGGLVQAVFQIAGIKASEVGTAAWCPFGEFC